MTQTESNTLNNDNSHHIMLSDSDSHTISLAHTVHIYSDGDVYWDKGGKAGEIKGNVFYNSGGHEIAHLGADWKIYDVNNHQIGYLDSHGYARNMADEIVDDQGNARENASQLIYNFASPK